MVLSTLMHSHGIICAHCNCDPYEIQPDESEGLDASDIERGLDGVLLMEVFLPLYRQLSEQRIGTTSESFNNLAIRYTDDFKLSYAAKIILQRYTPCYIG